MFDGVNMKLVVVLASEIAALWLIVRLWRSGEHLLFKLSLSLIAVVPVVGPLLAIWMSNFPSKVPGAFQDKSRFSADVFERWASIHRDPDPQRRLQRWASEYEQGLKEPTDSPPRLDR